MSRLFKLTILFLLSAFYFTWNVLVIIILLNSQTLVSKTYHLALFLNLILYYGPIWFIFIGLVFFIFQFFAEKKYPIGFIHPPAFTYLFTFTTFLITLVLFLNYEYYLDFFTLQIRQRFVSLLLLDSLVIFIGAFFFFIRNRKRHVFQSLFFLTLAASMLLSYSSILNITVHPTPLKSNPIPISTPRKIKILFLDALDLNFIVNLSSSQKLLNFDWIRNNGVVGRITTFSPKFNLSLINTILSGQKPFEFQNHSNSRYQLRDVPIEFDIFPRYIFFRNSAKLKLVTFYKKENLLPLDNIQDQFEGNGFETFSLPVPIHYPVYSVKNLLKNNTFLQFFPDVNKKKGKKIELLKRAFFLDDFLVHRIPNFQISNIEYFVLHLSGLDAVSTHFYHYAHPQDFRNISDEQVQEYGSILEKYYTYYDYIVGRMIGTMGENELLVIISLYETEPLPLWRRVLLNYIGNKEIFVFKSNTSPGLLLMYEKKALRKQTFLQNVSIYDLYPTLLYYAGFALSKNLNGEVLREIFTDQFILNNPIITIAAKPQPPLSWPRGN